MVSSTRLSLSRATVLQLVAEAFWMVVAVLLVFYLEGVTPASAVAMLGPALIFAVLVVAMQSAFGLYRRDQKISVADYVSRLFLAMLIVAPITYVAAGLLPGGRGFRDTMVDVLLLAFAGLVIVRYLVIRPVLDLVLPHRVLVLGTGPEARLVEASMTSADLPGVRMVGFYALDDRQESAVAANRIVARGASLDETVGKLGVSEIIVAVREQRGGVLPLGQLLECRLAGVQVTDLPRFFERVHGQIPIEALKASWLIYGSGFRQSWGRSAVKRAFDIVVSLAVVAAVFPIMLVAALVIAIESGSPIIYRQERVGLRGRTFQLIKFRSMRQDAEQDGAARWAAVGDARVTPFGRFMRRTRIDELPQLLNVLRGEMSFVGPRPERPAFVAMLAEEIPFYMVRQSIKPGLTGWAQVRYSYGSNVEQSKRKLEYDLYYVKNHTLFLDIVILLETVRVVLFGHGAR